MTVQLRRSVALRSRTGKGAGLRAALAGAAALLGVAGCVAPSRVNAPRSYVVAARYEPPRAARPDVDWRQAVGADLRQIGSLGFDAVVVEVVDETTRSEILAAAGNAQLRVYLTDADLHYYLLTGRVRNASTTRDLVRRKAGAAEAPNFAGLAILDGYPRDRVGELAAVMTELGVDYLVPGQGRYETGGGAQVAWLDAVGLKNPAVSPLERLLLEYHRELLAGWTDGLVVAFHPGAMTERRPTPELEGTTVAEEFAPQPSAGPRAQFFAVESLLRRARAWGPMICGARVEGVAMASPYRGLSAGLLTRDQRSYLLILNPSSEPVRGQAELAAGLGGRRMARAVEVPAGAGNVAGKVATPRGDELGISLDLRPGDAVLYELFFRD